MRAGSAVRLWRKMPIYEYVCCACGGSFEHLARTLSEKAPVCPVCGSGDVRKELSTFSTASVSRHSECSGCRCASDGGGCCAMGGCCGNV